MKLVSDSFNQGQAIPAQFAFARIAPDTHITLSDNINPHLAWTDIPAGTQSLVLICHDANVPSTGEDVNQEGKTLPLSQTDLGMIAGASRKQVNAAVRRFADMGWLTKGYRSITLHDMAALRGFAERDDE